MAGVPSCADHAVVIGGSIAGLLAAAALAPHCAKVTLLERDRLPEGPHSRRGTPQDGHCHALLVAGSAAIERIHPGFDAELAAAGADTGDALGDVLYSLPDGWVPQSTAGLRTRAASRRLIEWTLRRRTKAIANVTVLDAMRVSGLAAKGDRVCGVRLHEGETVVADMVVDASGRGSRLPDWLAAAGYGRPPETTLDSGLAYASRRFVRPRQSPGWQAMLIVADTGAHPRYGAIYPEEDGRWAVALAGARGEVPPRDPDGFMEFARGLRNDALHDAVAQAEPVGPVMTWRATANRLRHYHRMRRWPNGLFALGDAVAALNPIYGQGMTLAALGAVALAAECGKGRDRGSGRRFQRRLARINLVPWLLATSEDSRFAGRVPTSARLARFYTERLRRRIPGDPVLALAFMRTLQLTEPMACVRPAAMLRTLRPIGCGGRRQFDMVEALARAEED